MKGYRSPVVFCESREDGRAYFIRADDPKHKIYEYDIQSNNIKYLTDELSIRRFLFLSNKMDSECTYTMHLPDISCREAYGWLDVNTFLFTGDFRTTSEVNVATGETINLENDLVQLIHLSADKRIYSGSWKDNRLITIQRRFWWEGDEE